MLCHFILFVSTVPVINSFLLEPAYTVQPGTKQQCLSFETFVAEKDELTRAIYQTQHNMDQNLQVLTAQLNRKLATVESTMNEYESINDTLQSLQTVEERYLDLTENYTKLQEKLHSLQNLYETQKTETIRLQNRTLQLENEVTDLNQVNNVQLFHNVQSLQQELLILKQSTALLTNNQNARNQDFLALYNQTLSAEQKIKDLQNNTTVQFQHYATVQNFTFDGVFLKMKNLQHKVTDNSKQVALTACVGTSGPITNAHVRFQNVYTQIGVNNIAAFQSTGNFTCEIGGLYHISAYIRSNTNNFNFYLMRNNNVISRSAISNWSSELGYLFSISPIVAVVDAKQHDTLYIKTSGTIHVDSIYSCITIIKVK